MASLSEIVNDPNFVNANDATKKAIFDKWSIKDPNYASANEATKAAIRQKYGVETSAVAEEPAAPARPTPQQQMTTSPAPARPTPQQIERQQGAALVAPKEDSAMTPYEGEGGAAFGAYRKIKTQKPPVEDDAEKPIAFKELYTNPDNLKKIQDYATVRFGESGKMGKGETPEQYVNRFARHMRFLDTNEINYFSEQDWLNSAKSEDVVKAGQAYDLFENTAGFLSEGGQNPLRALADYTSGIVSAPSTAASLGVGKVVTGPVAKKVMSEGLKRTVMSRTGAVGIGAPMTVETLTNVSANVAEQRRDLSVVDATAKEMKKLLPSLSDEQKDVAQAQINEMESAVKEGVDVKQAVVVGAITAPVSFILETGPLLAAAKKPTKLLSGGTNITFDEMVDARRKQLNISKGPTQLTGDPAADNVVVSTTNVYDGGDLLDEQGSPTSIAQMQVKNSIDKQADLIAASIWQQIPEMAPKADEKTFDAVQRTLNDFDRLEPAVIEKALADAGTDLPNFLTRLEAGGLDTDALQKFSAMYGVSTSDAARTLQSKSVISRMLNKMRNIDPEAAKAVDALMGKPTVNENALMAFVQKADRNMITAMTTNMATVMRNAFGVGLNATYGAAEDALESLIFNTSRKIAGHMRGKPVTGDIGRGIFGAIDDAVDTFYYLGQADLSKDITERTLQHNPMLMSKLLTLGEETNKSDLIAPVRILNTPAMIMDNYIRRAVFASSIDYHLRQTGLDLTTIIAQGKEVPIDILRKGVDDALDFTFSKSPTDKLGSSFINIVEAGRPLTTVVVPFARFMTNAIKWTLKHYNPGVTTVTGATDIVKGTRLLKNGDDAGQALLLQGSKKIAQQATGAATLIAAIKYREENQDTAWNEMKSDDGTTVDIQYLFPLNVPFALADFYVKSKEGRPEDFKTMQLVEALTGLKAVGSTSMALENARDAAVSITAGFTGEESDDVALNKFSNSVSEFIGAWLGRAAVPLNQVSDLISLFDSDESIRRDVGVSETGEPLSALEVGARQIQKNIPILKQALPEYQPATREVSPRRDTGPFKQATGLSLIPPKNEIETEIAALNIPFQTVFRTTGDKTLDAQARKIMAERIDDMLLPYLQSDAYKGQTREAKFINLSNMLRDLQKESKNIAKELSIARSYNEGEVPNIEKKQFEALNPKLRQAVLDFYKQQKGVSLDESTDKFKFREALELSKEIRKNPQMVREEAPKFNAGGLIGKKVAKTIGKSSVADDALEALDAAKRNAVKQTEELLSPAATPKPTVVPETKMTPQQMEKAVAAPKSAYDFPNKAFADEDYAAAEAQLEQEMGQMAKNMKVTQPKEYANMLQSYAAQAKGVKYKDMPPAPYKLDEIVDAPVEDDIVESTYDKLPPDVEEDVPLFISPKATKGSLSGIIDFADRDDMLNQIKEVRTEAFPALRKSSALKGIDNIVIGNVQGDFRFANGREVNPADSKDVAEFAKMARASQKKLDALREKYKNTPPITLYHGAKDDVGAETVRGKGFVSTRERKPLRAGQQELNANIVSFGKDLNMYFKSDAFGGKKPERFVSIEYPYADYVFSRINMPQRDYDKKNLSVIARAISGDPQHVRPLSLPRADMYESEDSIVDFEKLKRSTGKLALPDDELKNKISVYDESRKLRDEKYASLYSNVELYKKNKDIKSANAAYRDIRDFTKILLSNTTASKGVKPEQKVVSLTSTRTGLGQSFDTNITNRIPARPTTIRRIAQTLREGGSKERANLLERIADDMEVMQDIEESSVKEKNKAR